LAFRINCDSRFGERQAPSLIDFVVGIYNTGVHARLNVGPFAPKMAAYALSLVELHFAFMKKMSACGIDLHSKEACLKVGLT
jgi:hypothetical protein